ncbi:hypothetical protein DSO57_1023403 [Entomophthora muscae]|uniref:Uncharacterized protein n=1 Tax=Entomophthora muscae TaxID=34485 RepID=A0ACC2T2Z7_9FUNG|nr:hypothetical protein DSO57_1023403 [Entomophthora muscae]
MELQRRGTFLLVDAFNAKIVCDQCRSKHLKCSREAPACHRCSSLGINCTRKKTGYDSKVIYGLSRSGWLLKSKTTMPGTWGQVVQSFSSIHFRYFMQRYLMPLALLLPRPSQSTEILKMSENIVFPRILFLLKTPSHTNLHEIIHPNIKATAYKMFFKIFNITYPLFSEQSFYANPRSKTLNKLIIQIGLERLPQTLQQKTALQENNLTLDDIIHLPLTLDTLQCLLLLQFGTRPSWITKVRFRIQCTIHRLISLLGLHKTHKSSPQWLERTLALHLVALGEHGLSVGQSIKLTQYVWIKEGRDHLNSNFLPLMTNLNQFPHLNDRIHFITSQAIYHSFTIILKANRDYTTACQTNTKASVFSDKLNIHLKHLKENFDWGWLHLSHLTTSPESHHRLLRQSRLTLALRHNNDYIELMKLASYIPIDTNRPLSSTPITNRNNLFSQAGLNMAIRTIQLAITLTTAPFDLDYILIQIPSIAFIIAHLKATKSNSEYAGHLIKTLILSRDSLTKGISIPFHGFKATAYLHLIDFFLKQQNIHFLKHS